MRDRDQDYCPFCVGKDGRAKRAYESSEEARDAASHIRQRRGVELRVYQCEDTWRWHLTSDLSGGW